MHNKITCSSRISLPLLSLQYYLYEVISIKILPFRGVGQKYPDTNDK